MNILSLPAVLALTINFSVALRVLVDRPRAAAHRLFFAFILTFVVWDLGEILMINSATISTARIGAHLVALGFFLSPALFLLVTFHFPRRGEHRLAGWPYGLLIPALPLAFLIASLPEPMMSVFRVPALGNIYFHALPPLRTWTLWALIVVGAVFLAWGVRNLLVSRRRAHSHRERFQALALVVGIVAIELFATAIHLVHAFFPQHRSFFFLSTGLSIVISGFFGVAILRYGLVNLRALLRQSLTYSLVSAFILGAYFLLIRHATVTLSAAFGIRSAVFEGALIFFLVLLIRPLEENIRRVMEHVFHSRRTQLRRRIEECSRELSRHTDLAAFLDRVEECLKELSGTSRVGIIIQEKTEDGAFLLRSEGKEARVRLSLESPLFRRIAAGAGPIEVEELVQEAPDDEVSGSLATMGYHYLLPLRFDGDLRGMLALCHKGDRSEYSVDELELFALFAQEVGIALSRVLVLEEARAKEARLHQAEKLGVMGQLVAGIAHEIRNPLNVISSAAQTLERRRLSAEERSKLLQFIVDETERLDTLLGDFLRLARPRRPAYARGQLGELFRAVAHALAARAEANGVRIVVPETEAQIVTDFQILEQVILNLASNAIEAMPDGGTLILRADLSVPGWLIVHVQDTGPGIPPEIRGRIFEPFFTTKGNGTGLGLSIAYTLVEALSGQLSFRTGPDGTTFSVRVPIER